MAEPERPGERLRTNRREFLTRVGAASAALAGGVTVTGAVARAWPLAVRLMSYGAWEEDAWTHLPGIGVKHLFMKVPLPAEVAAVRARLARQGLAAVVFRGEADVAREDFASRLEPQLGVCAELGVKYLFLSVKCGEAPREGVYARLRQGGEAAARHGVTLTLETHPDLGTNGALQVETMRAVAHPNVRVNFDTGNITYYNTGTDAVTELRKSIAYVRTVEFKDHTGGFETWDFPVAGRGRVNFPAIVALLREHGYAGPVTLEFEGTRGVELNREQTLAAIADSVAYVRSLGGFA